MAYLELEGLSFTYPEAAEPALVEPSPAEPDEM